MQMHPGSLPGCSQHISHVHCKSARCCCSKGEKHILVSTINHAGLDALNAFQIYNSLLTYIGLLSAGKTKTMQSACGIAKECCCSSQQYLHAGGCVYAILLVIKDCVRTGVCY